ncbi:MAG: hypothetical protein J3K34DRAFT_517092 [Monoraphidium minutum]|nr:MAG: hypothetical protein J3K34DRAFT_517092 [Monoraphidium minutum]
MRSGPILQLPEAVVHRIAAGEVIQRPASALKEMVENSIDAGASRVAVTLKEGGLRLLQVADDGCGVAAGDLPLLCVRHATSKLRAYEDLETVATLGFRGEALASISFVAHLGVVTMARGDPHGWRASYQDGALLEPPGPRPCAAVPGTVLTVEDLFFNVPARRKAFRAGGAEEGALRYAVWAAPRVGFSLRRQGEARADLATAPGASRLDVIRQLHGPDLAAALLPLAVARGEEPSASLPHDAPGGPHLRAQGYVTGLAWAGRRSGLVLFINGRCVECGPLKRGAEAVYASLVPRAAKPWMFLDVTLPPRQVEVNVHPTKREVGFLHQDEVIDAICRDLEAALLAAMSSRTFATQVTPATVGLRLAEQLARGGSGGGKGQASQAGTQQQTQQDGAAAPPPPPPQPAAYRPDKLVRADHRMRTMDAFVVRGAAQGGGSGAAGERGDREAEGAAAGEAAAQARGASGVALAAVAGGVPRKRRAAERDRLAFSSSMAAAAAAAGGDDADEEWQLRGGGGGGEDGGGGEGDEAAAAGGTPAKPPRQAPPTKARQWGNPPGPPPLPAARELLAAREGACHEGLAALVKQHVFVGLADEAGSWALLQQGTRLYLAAVAPLSRDLFELQALRRWGRCPRAALAEPLPLEVLAAAGLALEEAAGRWQPCDGPIPELAALTARLLAERASALAAAGLVVDGQGRLAALPVLLDGYAPDPARLPALVLALARDVDWGAAGGDDSAPAVVGGVAAALAEAYALEPLAPSPDVAAGGGCGGEDGGPAAAADPAATVGCAPDAMEVDGSGSAAAVDGGGGGADAVAWLAPHRRLPEREWAARHVVFPAMKALLRPRPGRARDGTFVLLTSMERLYRVFERCG